MPLEEPDYDQISKKQTQGLVDSMGRAWEQAMKDLTAPTHTGRKNDDSKPDMSLLDPEWLEEVAWVMTFGKQKYDAHNWRGGISVSRLLSAAYRHLGAINRGEDIDPESGRSHIGHASCCLQFAYWMIKHHPELDDRYKY